MSIDDEREALTSIIDNATMIPSDDLERAADDVLRAGFRRSEVPEPSAEQRIGCNLCGEALPDGEPHICSEPQGEPSDAQVVAAVDAFMASQLESEDGPTLVHKNMAAALRAASAVTEQGEGNHG